MKMIELVAELDALYEKVTKGPWNVAYTDCYEIVGNPLRVAILYATDQQKHNADLIAALHNYWPLIRSALSSGEEARRATVEECAKVCDELARKTKVTCAWDEGEATGYEEAAQAIRALDLNLRGEGKK